jgi:alkanesulfonate monooxygenase SsuD/methylene tetrahydromethanopterin reductase-like flavin-dependent oxidoreductase (luciferase family)
MIGGSGERATLRLVAHYADYSNVGGDPATVAHKFDVLRRHCETAGRRFDAITHCNHVGILVARDAAELAAKKQRFPNFNGIAGTPEMILSQLQAYAQVGSQYVTFNLVDDKPIEAVQLLGEAVVPAAMKL